MEKKKTEMQELKEIRKSGSIKDIDRVISILRSKKDTDIAKEAAGLLADIKLEAIKEVLINSLKDQQNQDVRKEILQACWESGLDYSDHLIYLVDLFLSLDYEAAIEAFTLIENTFLDFNPSETIKPVMIQKIKTVVVDLPIHKQNLAMEMLGFLNG